jgi:phosphoglycerate dehydrogenase-like enzyme
MLDVHDPSEPIKPDYPLLSLPNARLTPHLASGTERAKRNMSWVVRDVWRVLNGEKPEFEAP